MKITKFTNYESGFSFLQKIAVIAILGSFLLVGFIFFSYTTKLNQYSEKYIEHMTEKQWVLDKSTGAVYKMGNSYIDKTSREAEYKHHINMVYQSFFAFSPYDNFEEKLNGGLYLVSEDVGGKIIKQHDRNELELKLRDEDMHLYVHLDSIIFSYNENEINGIAFARQRIEKPRGKAMRNIYYEFSIENINVGSSELIKRTEKNSHGVLVTRWKLVDNKKIQYSNRTSNY